MDCLRIASLIIAVTAAGAARADDNLRALLVTGGHDFDRPPFEEMLAAIRGVTFTEVAQPDAAAWFAADKRGEYDVIVLYDLWQDITDEGKRGLLEAIESGKGVVVLHHALGSYDKWEEWHRAIGGHFYMADAVVDGERRPASTWHEGVDIDVSIADTDHPITRGIDPFTVHDEVYGGFWVSPDAHVLLTTDNPESGHDIAWTHECGKGRIACIQLGHGAEAYGNATYRELVRRASTWVAGRLE